MKTLREVLFEKHQGATPRLDAIREQVIAGLGADGGAEAPIRSKRMAGDWPLGASAVQTGWREFLWSLRWHLAGVSAVWLVALALSIDPAPAPAPAAAHQDVPSPKQVLAALRENQRQLRELIAAPASEAAPEPTELAPSPQSRMQSGSTAAV